MDDYVRARTVAGSESLTVMATEYGKMFGNIVRRATVPEVMAELLRIREPDGASTKYLGQLRTSLNRFAIMPKEGQWENTLTYDRERSAG